MKGLGPLGILGLAVPGMVVSCAIGQEAPRTEEPRHVEAFLGVETRAPTEDEIERYELSRRVRAQGRVIVHVAEDGPASRAALGAGDIILKLDENDLYSQDDIADFLRVSRPGQEVAIRVRSREGDGEESVKVTLGGLESREGSSKLLRWQFAGLGQLPKALEQARAEKKKVLIGLSGAET